MLKALSSHVLQAGSRVAAESSAKTFTGIIVSRPQGPFTSGRTMASSEGKTEGSETHSSMADSPQGSHQGSPQQSKPGAEASAKPQTASAGVGSDLFTQAMESKAEEQLRRMLEQQSRLSAASTQASSAGSDAEDDEDLDEDDKILPNPETGEVLGPAEKNQGKEPTRFGDWEIRGRCTDW
ncbi:hypothetical protein DUNSADRAFT_1546 [Dunaliella salina]|uniref:Succinate dehydrogenase assembly factor 4, mitochondrial n=1 Tax=Dunaliella salina TaxID=3046 RepID=A0ABQ7FXB5_DUNSA|nr:hypothetical protein DUNSADRAFT_1546 [Dunaliella salina]|eukprot:KAF5826997.1 hypothetical protein DUNSADRAFT_1546 [Dunaliella salina]